MLRLAILVGCAATLMGPPTAQGGPFDQVLEDMGKQLLDEGMKQLQKIPQQPQPPSRQPPPRQPRPPGAPAPASPSSLPPPPRPQSTLPPGATTELRSLRVDAPETKANGTFWDSATSVFAGRPAGLRPDIQVCIRETNGSWVCSVECPDSLRCETPMRMTLANPAEIYVRDLDARHHDVIAHASVADPHTCQPCVFKAGNGTVALFLHTSPCTALKSAGGNGAPHKAIDDGLAVVNRYLRTTKSRLAAYEARGNSIYACTDQDHTYYHQEQDLIVLSPRQMGRGLDLAVRTLMEEINHANMPRRSWPNPKTMTRKDYVTQLGSMLLEEEARALMEVVKEIDLAESRSQLCRKHAICILEHPDRQIAQKVRRTWDSMLRTGKSEAQILRAFKYIMANDSGTADPRDQKKVITYPNLFERQAKKEWDCVRAGGTLSRSHFGRYHCSTS